MSLEVTMPPVPRGERSIQILPSPLLKEARVVKHLTIKEKGEIQQEKKKKRAYDVEINCKFQQPIH
jgi:hypothetical protein